MFQGTSHADFLNRLEKLFDLPAGSLHSDTRLSDLSSWNSLAQVEFMAFADECYATAISGEALRSCRFVADLEVLVSSAGKGVGDGAGSDGI